MHVQTAVPPLDCGIIGLRKLVVFTIADSPTVLYFRVPRFMCVNAGYSRRIFLAHLEAANDGVIVTRRG